MGGHVLVVGLGYVGLPLALRAVEVGYEVVGYDVSAQRVEMLKAAHTYLDDVSDLEIKEALVSGRFHPTDEVEGIDGFATAVIAVPTPLRDGAPDLGAVQSAGQTLGARLRRGACVVLESTTYPGTTQDMLVPILEASSGLRAGVDFSVGFSPERIDPGNARWTFARTPKIISGIDEASLARVRDFYERLVDRVVPVSSPREAELAKLLENTFRHVNIALVNEMSVYAHHLGIDIWEVIEAAATKPFGFMPFRPGPGVGGHCLPIDPSYLSWQVRQQLGTSFRFIELANDVNEHMPEQVVRRVMMILNRRERAVCGSKVLLLGAAYKKNCRDARESPALRVGQLLVDLGARVSVADPLVDVDHAMPGQRVEATAGEVADADLVIVLTEHDAFDWETIMANARLVFDTRRCVMGDNVEYL